MWELDHIEGWVVKNWCLRIVVLEKTLESPWDSKDIKPVNPKGSQPWIFTGRTVLKLKLLCFSHLMWRANSLEKTMMLGKTEAGGEGGFREWDGWMASLTQWTWVCTNSGRWWRTEKPGVLRSMGSQRVGPNWATEQQQQNISKAPDVSHCSPQRLWTGLTLGQDDVSEGWPDRCTS